MPASAHTPVMLRQVLEVLAPRDGAIYVDATFGAGGYSEAVLKAARCTVWGIDRDPDAVRSGTHMERRYPGRFTVIHGRYGDITGLLGGVGVDRVDGVALDLGLSSMQLDAPARGFSFQADGPLDMRMGGDGPSAADAVNSLPERELARIIYQYGEERLSRSIARAIVSARNQGAIETTAALAEIVVQLTGNAASLLLLGFGEQAGVHSETTAECCG